jgi:hypothetical protein
MQGALREVHGSLTVMQGILREMQGTFPEMQGTETDCGASAPPAYCVCRTDARAAARVVIGRGRQRSCGLTSD